jgi:hypothetical protein
MGDFTLIKDRYFRVAMVYDINGSRTMQMFLLDDEFDFVMGPNGLPVEFNQHLFTFMEPKDCFVPLNSSLVSFSQKSQTEAELSILDFSLSQDEFFQYLANAFMKDPLKAILQLNKLSKRHIEGIAEYLIAQKGIEKKQSTLKVARGALLSVKKNHHGITDEDKANAISAYSKTLYGAVTHAKATSDAPIKPGKEEMWD